MTHKAHTSISYSDLSSPFLDDIHMYGTCVETPLSSKGRVRVGVKFTKMSIEDLRDICGT